MITPLDIENKKFAKQMVNGYNVNEVDDFLDEVTAAYEKLYKENAELKANAEELNNDVGQYKNIETTIQSTLVMAQKTADEIQAVAKKQAEQIIKDAETKSKQSVDELNLQITIKQKEIEELKRQFDVYKAKMESLLISQLELIKDINSEE
ncbi:MAG: DivIVA domain-containing protein [Clostridia bacterium]